MLFSFTEGIVRMVFGSLPLIVLLGIFPDKRPRNQKVDLGDGKEITIYRGEDGKEERGPIFKPVLLLYCLVHFGICLSFLSICVASASWGEVIASLFISPIIVGDVVLAFIGLDQWVMLPQAASCFK